MGVADADEEQRHAHLRGDTWPTLTKSSPSVVTPSVSMTTAASDEPRKSLSTWRTALPSWLAFAGGLQALDSFRPRLIAMLRFGDMSQIAAAFVEQ